MGRRWEEGGKKIGRRWEGRAIDAECGRGASGEEVRDRRWRPMDAGRCQGCGESSQMLVRTPPMQWCVRRPGPEAGLFPARGSASGTAQTSASSRRVASVCPVRSVWKGTFRAARKDGERQDWDCPKWQQGELKTASHFCVWVLCSPV